MNERTNEHTNGRTDKRQGENYIPRGINAGGIMTMSVKFCLLYDPSNWNFIIFKMNIISISKHIDDTDFVNDATCTYQSVIPCVVIRFL